MSLAAMPPRALIAWPGGDSPYRQREPAALVLTAAAGAGRGQLGVRQALLPLFTPCLNSRTANRVKPGAAAGAPARESNNGWQGTNKPFGTECKLG